MSDEDLRVTEAHEDDLERRGITIDQMALDTEKEIYADPACLSDWVDCKRFANTIGMTIQALPGDDTELGRLVRLAHKDVVEEAAYGYAEKMHDDGHRI